jgi:ribose/xylose/arabinose/galactoside ABC-type transport system permease subunit
LRLRRRLDKAQAREFRRPPMIGIAVIVIFIAVIAILNRVEFGRFD